MLLHVVGQGYTVKCLFSPSGSSSHLHILLGQQKMLPVVEAVGRREVTGLTAKRTICFMPLATSLVQLKDVCLTLTDGSISFADVCLLVCVLDYDTLQTMFGFS